MQQMSSPKQKKLESWREEYLSLRRQIFTFDEDEDVFSLFKLNSKDLKYKGTIRRLQIEYNEDNFNRDLEKNEMLSQIQIMRREQGTVLRRMDENWQNPRMMNYLKGEAAKLIQKQNDFKNFHGQNFGFIEEEKDNLIDELDNLNIDSYLDINFNSPSAKSRQQHSASPQTHISSYQNKDEHKKKRKTKKKRKEFKSQEGLTELVQGQDTSKKSSSDDDDDDNTIQKYKNQQDIKRQKKKPLSIDGSHSNIDEEDIDFDHDDRPSLADVFVTQDKKKIINGNQYLSKVSELPEEESRQMTQKFASNILASKGKSNVLSPRGENNKVVDEAFLHKVKSEYVDDEEIEQIYETQIDDQIVIQDQRKRVQNHHSYSPEKHKKKFTQQEYPEQQYNTPQRGAMKSSPRRISDANSLERGMPNIRRVGAEQSRGDKSYSLERGRSNSPNGQNSKQNISLLDKSLNNISNIEEDQKDMQQIKEFVKRIDDLIKDIGGVNCGWKESDHRSFLYLMKKYGNHGLRSKEAMSDAVISVLQFYTDKELLDHINVYNQYTMLIDQKQKYIEEYKQITQRLEKRRQVELDMLKQVRKERELSQLKERIHSTVQRTEFYVKQFEEIKRKYKDVEVKSSLDYQKRQRMREKEVYDMVQRRQTQKEMIQAISSKKSQQDIKKANMLKEINENEKIQSLIPKDYPSNVSPNALVNQERISSIQKDLYSKMLQLEELRKQSKSKRIQHTYFTPQIKKKHFSPPHMKIALNS